MKFKFALQSVLKHRQRLEEIAQREFAEAQDAVDKCLRRIEAMYARLDEVREEIRQRQGRGLASDIERVREMEAFIHGQGIRVEAERRHARDLMTVAEAAQEKLMRAAQEKKILEKLRERKLAQHAERARFEEAKELDDLTTTRQAWGKS